MSAYCVPDDVTRLISERVIQQLTDDDRTGSPISEIIEGAITDEAALVDTYIGKVCALPIDTPYPAILTKFNSEMAVYNLFCRNVMGPPEQWQKKYDACLKTLSMIAKGEITIGNQPAPTAPESSGYEAQVYARDQIYSVTNLDKY